MSNDDNDVICTICYDSLKKNKPTNCIHKVPPIISLSCCHSYHFNCINTWFTKSCSFLCPVCKLPDRVLLENFLPEIKKALHNEILKSGQEFLIDKEHEKYYEDCIKQGNMLKIIERQEIINKSNGIFENNDYLNLNDNYSDHFYHDIHNLQLADFDTYLPEFSYHNHTNINNVDNINDFQEIIECREISSYPYLNSNNNYAISESEYEDEYEDEYDDIYKNEFENEYENEYVNEYDDEYEDEYEDDYRNKIENETITYARGVINCILDDEEGNNNHYNHNQKALNRYNRSSNIENIFDFLSNQDKSQNFEEYENIFLNSQTKPSLFRRYRFYFISFTIFAISYFTFIIIPYFL